MEEMQKNFSGLSGLGCTDEVTAEFISSRSGDVTVGVSSEAKQLNTWRVSDYSPEYRKTQSIGKRKLLTPDEILRLPLDTALIILRGQKVLKVQKYDYTLHPDAKKLVTRKAAEHIPKWREDGKTEEYDYLPKPPPKPRRQRNSSSASVPRKPLGTSTPAMPTQATQKQVYQEPQHTDSSDLLSDSLWPDEPEMVPLDKNSIMS
nr:type IV secretory system conjugative DNA transfer family protein [uncultured Schaedlerella sp.]